MSKRPKRSDNPNQLNLLDLIQRLQRPHERPAEGSLNAQAQLRVILSESIKKCPLSRWEIAGRMSMFVGQEISKYMLDTWTAESKEYHRFPAEYLPAFCEATGCTEPMRFLADRCGMYALPGEAVLLAELAKRMERRDTETQEIRRLKALLKEITRGKTSGS